MKLVERIIEGKRNRVDTKNEEREINEIVYKLYDLNEEEIRIIENGN